MSPLWRVQFAPMTLAPSLSSVSTAASVVSPIIVKNPAGLAVEGERDDGGEIRHLLHGAERFDRLAEIVHRLYDKEVDARARERLRLLAEGRARLVGLEGADGRKEKPRRADVPRDESLALSRTLERLPRDLDALLVHLARRRATSRPRRPGA